MKNFIKKAAILLGIALVFTIIILAIIPFIVKSNPKIMDVSKFTKADLDRICGVELRQDEREFGNEKCIKYWNNRNIPTVYDNLTFYLFDSNRKASKAYNDVLDRYNDKEDLGSDYFIAQEIGTIDASCTYLYYIHKNLIIKVCVYSVSEMATNPDDPDANPVYQLDKDEVLKLIRDNF